MYLPIPIPLSCIPSGLGEKTPQLPDIFVVLQFISEYMCNWVSCHSMIRKCTRFVRPITIHDSSMTEHIQQWFPYANVDGGGDTERVVNNTCGCWFQPTGPWLGLLLNNTHAQPTHLTVKEKKCSYKQRSQLQLISECTSAILEVLCHQLLLSVPKSLPVWALK